MTGTSWLLAQEQDFARSQTYTVNVLPGLGGLAGAFSVNDLGWASGLSEPKNDAYDRAFLCGTGKQPISERWVAITVLCLFQTRIRSGWIAGIHKGFHFVGVRNQSGAWVRSQRHRIAG